MMGWYNDGESGDSLDGVAHVVVRARACVAFVAHHHGRPLAVAHGACSGVGEEIDIDLFRFQLEYVVVSLANPLLTLLRRAHADRLHHFDTPRFGKG